jgi:hypothetical protein
LKSIQRQTGLARANSHCSVAISIAEPLEDKVFHYHCNFEEIMFETTQLLASQPRQDEILLSASAVCVEEHTTHIQFGWYSNYYNSIFEGIFQNDDALNSEAHAHQFRHQLQQCLNKL